MPTSGSRSRRRRRRDGRGVPEDGEGVSRGSRPGALMAPSVWYHVRDLDAARRFYRETLGFDETAVDFTERWSHLQHGEMELGLAEGEPDADGAVAHVDVSDVKAEAERLRSAGVDVGVVVEIPHGAVRLLDVYDPDGNRIQLAQEL